MVAGGQERMVQGVRELFEIFENPSHGSGDGGVTEGKMVLIGRHLGESDFHSDLQHALGSVIS